VPEDPGIDEVTGGPGGIKEMALANEDRAAKARKSVKNAMC